MMTDECCRSCRYRKPDPYGWGQKCGCLQSQDYDDPVMWNYVCDHWKETEEAEQTLKQIADAIKETGGKRT